MPYLGYYLDLDEYEYRTRTDQEEYLDVMGDTYEAEQMLGLETFVHV
jgi:hypothetical protein